MKNSVIFFAIFNTYSEKILNLKIKNQRKTAHNINVRQFEEELTTKSIQYEKELTLKKLKEISDLYNNETIEFEGIPCKRKNATTKISIGRVTVEWNRPIFVGYKEGKVHRFYPADECLKSPKKTRGSYQILANCALISAFIPFDLAKKIINLLMGTGIEGSTVKRYTETVGQFAIENFDEVLAQKKSELILAKNEILIASIDGSSSLINGRRSKSNKRRKKKQKK